MKAVFHNLTYSPLCSLPEELLIDIMEYLDPLSIQCLRRTCRIFLRLFCSVEFAYACDDELFQHEIIQCQLWKEPNQTYWPQLSSQHLTRALEKDTHGFCGCCRALRESRRPSCFGSRRPLLVEKAARLTIDTLHCSLCRKEHPRVLFSPIQRAAPPADRFCIGREGYVRMCAHKVIGWQDMSAIAGQLASIDGNLRPIKELFVCRHPSHVTNCKGHFPSAYIQKRECDSAYLVLRWAGRLVVEDPGQQSTSPQSLERQLRRFRKGAAEFIAPEIEGRLPEMNCFDPNRCCCLNYEGAEQLPRGWSSPSPEVLKVNSCRLHHQYKLPALQPRHVREEQIDTWTDGHLHINPTMGSGVSTLVINVDPCGARCLLIQYERLIEISPPLIAEQPRSDHVTAAWCQALHPDSYDLTSDVESKGVNWCKQPGCKNYFGYLRKVVAPLLTI